jgi:hypothetical protein
MPLFEVTTGLPSLFKVATGPSPLLEVPTGLLESRTGVPPGTV